MEGREERNDNLWGKSIRSKTEEFKINTQTRENREAEPSDPGPAPVSLYRIDTHNLSDDALLGG